MSRLKRITLGIAVTAAVLTGLTAVGHVQSISHRADVITFCATQPHGAHVIVGGESTHCN